MANTGTYVEPPHTGKPTSPAHSYRRLRDVPRGAREIDLVVGGKAVRLTNLKKLFWPDEGITKRALLEYYEDVGSVVLPHIQNRAMVMKRYPDGASGEFFFQKRAPSSRPDYIPTCSIEHSSGNIVNFPVINELASLLWLINLGCIDLNQWYATCDDVNRPDYLHFDLDPVPAAGFECVLETALRVKDALDALDIPCYPKTTGSRGIHIYIPIQRGPKQKQVWSFAKELALELAAKDPALITSEYRVAKRPKNHVLVDYNQNVWGRTLASVYSVWPKPGATVSAPLTWDEVKRGVRIEDFRLDNMPDRIRTTGDLFKPLLLKKGRVRLEKFL